MKTTLVISLMLAASSSYAMDATQMKEAALKACQTQLEQVPEEMRAQSKKACECSVNKTDYKAMLDAQQAGDTEKLQADAVKVAQECAAELK